MKTRASSQPIELSSYLLFGRARPSPASQPKNQSIQKKCLLRKKILDRDSTSWFLESCKGTG